MRRLIPFILLVLMVVGFCFAVPKSAAQGGPSEDAITAVQDYFRTQYGQDFALVRYTWRAQVWEDTSLGCPRMGFSYDPQEVNGYVWELFLSDDTSYELHSDREGNLIVLCTSLDRSTTTRYRTYQNIDFVIDIPRTWQVSENDDLSLVIISPSGQEDCQDVGIKVQYLPVVGNADTMLDGALQTAGFVQNIGVRVPIGDNPDALALGYQAPCGNNLLQYRIGAFPNTFTGTGYLVAQWTPLETYSQWSQVYDQMLQSFRLADTLESIPEASADTPPELAFGDYPLGHVFVQDVYIGTFNTLPGQAITVGGAQARRGLRFSSDGVFLAYIDRSPIDSTERLEVAGRTLRRTQISATVAPYFSPTWAPDAATVAFLVPANEQNLTLRIGDPLNPNNVQSRGSIPFDNRACEDVSEAETLPQALYWQETGPQGNAFTFEWLLDGRFLFTTQCNGFGLAIWNPEDGSIEDLGADLHRANLNPDRSLLVALGADNQVFTINLATGERTLIPFEEPVEQVAWSGRGRFLYASMVTATDAGFTVDEPSLQEMAEANLGAFPYTSELNALSLIEFDLNRGTTRTIWQGQGYAIGRIVAAPNNGGIVFSLVPSDREWVSALLAQQDPIELRFAQPETALHWVSPTTENNRRIAISSYPVFAYTVPESESD